MAIISGCKPVPDNRFERTAVLLYFAMLSKVRTFLRLVQPPLLSAALAISLASCANVAQLTNLATPACQSSFSEELSAVLVKQGEAPDVAGDLARRTLRALQFGAFGPRPFMVAAPSGTDYTFFIQGERQQCLLRLYGRRKGFVAYTNNLTYIETRPLPRCDCAE
jgi:hypothetical protein